MHKITFKRGLGLAMTLSLALSGLPAIAQAAEEDGICLHHCAHTTDCGYSESSSCAVALEGCDECRGITNVTPIIGTDVLIGGHSFPYTGQAICPEITVTVAGQLLTEEEHYRLTFENNVEPGEASVTVTGIREAGYEGVVTIVFTITPASEPDDSQKPGDTEKPDDSQKPEDTEKPEDSENNDQTEETKPVEYKITKGSGSTWYQGSGKNLSFTANGKGKDFTGVAINGKLLNESDYSVSGDTVVTLNKGVLNKLAVGKYTITIRFADGEAEGTFHVSDRLDTTNPATGDESSVTLWALLAAGSLTGLAVMVLTTGRKKKQ